MGQGGAGQQWSGLLDFGNTDPNLSVGGFMDDDVARKDIDTNSGTKLDEFLVSMQRNGNSGTVFFNGSETTMDITGLGSLTNTNQFGRICAFRSSASDQGFINAKVQELIVYDSSQSATRAGLESNQNSYYSIY
jgi:hypothetical protein